MKYGDLRMYAQGLGTAMLWPMMMVSRQVALHPTPYTLHPAPYTLHHTPYTLNPTPCTLHSAPYALNSCLQDV